MYIRYVLMKKNEKCFLKCEKLKSHFTYLFLFILYFKHAII